MTGVEENKVPMDLKVKENKIKVFLVSLKHAGEDLITQKRL